MRRLKADPLGPRRPTEAARLAAARRCLANGGTLTDACRKAGMARDDLDQALWRDLGDRAGAGR